MGPDVILGLPSTPQVGDQSAPALRQEWVIACSPSTRGQGRAPMDTVSLASQAVSGWSLGEPRRSGSARCRGVRPARLTACPRVLAANVVCQEACPSSSILVVSGDSCLLAFVGPSKYTVSVMDTASLDEVSQPEPCTFAEGAQALWAPLILVAGLLLWAGGHTHCREDPGPGPLRGIEDP